MSGVAFPSTGLGGLISAFRGAAGVERRSSGGGGHEVPWGAGAPALLLQATGRASPGPCGAGCCSGRGGRRPGQGRSGRGAALPRRARGAAGPSALLSVPAGSAPQTVPLSAL